MAEGTIEDEHVEEEEELEFKPKVRWAIPQKLDQMAILGKEILAVAHDVYIIFLNLANGRESVYLANSPQRGDGVDVMAGHRTNMFAFAEKLKNARIFIVTYPAFQIMVELKDTEVNRYKGLCLMEGELVAGISGFPDYFITVWSWRLNQRLLCIRTGIIRRDQIIVASRSHMMVCQCYYEGLALWEVSPCYRRCYMMRRNKDPVSTWGLSEPPLVAICWTNEGFLYACDNNGRLYSVAYDGGSLQCVVEWKDEAIEGSGVVCMCSFGDGILMYGPDRHFRWLKILEDIQESAATEMKAKPDGKQDQKSGKRGKHDTRRGKPEPKKGKPDPKAKSGKAQADPKAKVDPRSKKVEAKAQPKKWRVAWKESLKDDDEVLRMVASYTGEVGVAWTRSGAVYRLAPAEDENINIRLLTYKQRDILRLKVIAPTFNYVVSINAMNEMCIYEVLTAKLMMKRLLIGTECGFQVSPVEPVIAVYGANGANYGFALYEWQEKEEQPTLKHLSHKCLTHQIVSRVVFSATGRHIMCAAMSAGHLFIYMLNENYTLTLVKYTEVGRGLADCFFIQVGQFMRALALVLFSDKYPIGERIICINAETGKENKFTGKMKGPYAVCLCLSTHDTMLAIPFMSRHYHVLNLSGDKGTTVSVKMGTIVDSGHELKSYTGSRGPTSLITWGLDGNVVIRHASGPPEYDYKMVVSHRYEPGVRYASVDSKVRLVVHIGNNRTAAVTYLHGDTIVGDLRHEPIAPYVFDEGPIQIFDPTEKNYLDIEEDYKTKEEALDYKTQREEVVKAFLTVQEKVVKLLEENIAEIPLHQISLSEFNLHQEFRRERLKQAEREREEIRLQMEARIRAQDKVTQWIKKTCWEIMHTQRVKIFAIFSHYQVENYPTLPTQREQWPELQQASQLRLLEMENDADLFKPWEETIAAIEPEKKAIEEVADTADMRGTSEQDVKQVLEEEETVEGNPYVLSGTASHKYITVPPFMIPQTLAFSFLQMNWLYQIVKLNVQRMRIWFNKNFDELMSQKRRECDLVIDRNNRLRFILSELNKLSDLRGSFHHLMIEIHDPKFRQEEEPHRLIKVEVHECTIPPWKSHISLPPPELKPKDDFRERALNEMMDGVLEKLWHEEIKKPIPKPQCMLDKDPENFNEEDLRQVFDYEAKVKFREEERDKYRKMLHAEYAKLSQVLNEGIVKFNFKVKDLWLTKLKTDSVIGQEQMNLMRLRRFNLDRVESAEGLEELRDQILRAEKEAAVLQTEVAQIQEMTNICQSTYDALSAKDRLLDRTFKNNFADYAPIIVDNCYKYFKKRPKWHQRASMIPVVLYELATAIATNTRPPLLHADCVEYFKGVEQLDAISNMPAVMDDMLWASMIRLRRQKIEIEIKMRAMVLENGLVEQTATSWTKALNACRQFLAQGNNRLSAHREAEHEMAINKSLQLVIPAGQVEITTTGHMEDFEDAVLMPKDDIEEINKLILRVGAIKLRLLRRQIDFRKGILMKEWEHAQMKMKLRHMQQELYTYGRLKIVKELQFFLKNKEKGLTDEYDVMMLEKEMQATKMMIERVLADSAAEAEEYQVKITNRDADTRSYESLIDHLNVKVSERRLQVDALAPIRQRQILKKRMETLVARSSLIREVQANHTRIVLLQTELELLRLKTFPTLATFRTFS